MKTLKYSIYILSVLLCASFSSCSDDDDDFSSNDLIGTWEIVTAKGWVKEKGKIVDEWDLSLEEDLQEIEEDYDHYVQFTEDGEIYSGNRVSSLTYDGDWEMKKNKLYTIEYDGERISTTIVKLTSSELILEGSHAEDGDEVYEKVTYRKVAGK